MFLFNMLVWVLLLFVFANSYRFAPIHKYVRHYDDNYGINVVERCKIEKKKTPCILFLTGGSGGIPPQIYSHFMDNLATHGFSIYTPHSQFKNRTLLIPERSLLLLKECFEFNELNNNTINIIKYYIQKFKLNTNNLKILNSIKLKYTLKN